MRTLNLNNYSVVPKADATLKVVLFEKDGIAPAPLFLRGNIARKEGVKFSEIDSVAWNPTIEIDITGTPDEYINLVKWWFTNAGNSDDFYEMITTKYARIKDVVYQIRLAKAWLIERAYTVNGKGEYLQRRTNVNKFLKGWLNRILKKIPVR